MCVYIYRVMCFEDDGKKNPFHLLLTCIMLMNLQQDRAEQVFDSTHQPPCVTTSYEPRFQAGIARAERDGTRAETRFRLSPKRTSRFKSVGASVHSIAGSRAVRISLSNAG